MVKYSLQPIQRRHWKRFLVPIGIFIVIAGILIFIIHNMSSPAEGTLSQTPPNQQAYQPQPYSQPGTYNGKYVSFTYPAHFKILPNQLDEGELEAVFLSSTDLSGRHISIAVRRGDLTSDSNVLYRQRTSSLYQQTDSRLGIYFTKLDGTENSYFIGHSGLIVSISVTAPSNILNGEAYFVASTLKWK